MLYKLSYAGSDQKFEFYKPQGQTLCFQHITCGKEQTMLKKETISIHEGFLQRIGLDVYDLNQTLQENFIQGINTIVMQKIPTSSSGAFRVKLNIKEKTFEFYTKYLTDKRFKDKIVEFQDKWITEAKTTGFMYLSILLFQHDIAKEFMDVRNELLKKIEDVERQAGNVSEIHKKLRIINKSMEAYDKIILKKEIK